MRFLWFTLLVLAVCAPLALVSLFLAEAYIPRLDWLTLNEPQGVRSSVGALAMSSVRYGKDAAPALERVLRLDPRNAEARERKCTAAVDANDRNALPICTSALKVNNSAVIYNAIGEAQEAAGDPCSAEQSFTSANSRVSPGSAFYLRNMGRAAYACGSFLNSAAEFSAAESLDIRSAAQPNQDQEDLDDAKQDLLSDREWLSAAYKLGAQPKLALQACNLAHPEWKTCACSVTGSKVTCAGSPSAAIPAPASARRKSASFTP